MTSVLSKLESRRGEKPGIVPFPVADNRRVKRGVGRRAGCRPPMNSVPVTYYLGADDAQVLATKPTFCFADSS